LTDRSCSKAAKCTRCPRAFFPPLTSAHLLNVNCRYRAPPKRPSLPRSSASSRRSA
jgi:hypothetical protein